ncbi:unnamed protein product [Coccothraustes coccothraustes]
MRLKAAPAAVRGPGTRAHGEGGRNGPHRGKAEDDAGPRLSLQLWAGERTGPGPRHRLVPPQPGGGIPLLPPGPCAHWLGRTPPSRGSQSSPPAWGRAFD